MSRLVSPRRVLMVTAMTLVWCGLWRELSAANLLAGFVIAVAVVSSGIGTPGLGGIRIRPLLRLTWLVIVDLAKSTIEVATEILTPTDHSKGNEAIIAVEVGPRSKDHFLLLTVAITLTPGTAVVDVEPDRGTLYLHLLHQSRRADTVTHVKRLVRLADEALPTTSIGVGP